MQREQARDEIKRHISCTDYLEKSKNNMYCCPICGSGHGQNGTGAVKYYQDTNTWHCHACDKGGDVLDAYQAATGSDYNAALSHLAAQIGITIDSRTTAAQDFSDDATERPQSDENAQKDKYPNDGEKAPQNTTQSLDFTSYYQECCSRANDPAAISYLQARGIDDAAEIMRRFNIGFDPAADPANAPGATADEYKPHPAPRIIVPCSPSHYVARSITPNTPATYKALNPSRKKGGGEVALFNAAALTGSDPVIYVTEGIFDALSIIEAGHQAIALNSKGNGKLLLQQLQAIPTEAAFAIITDDDPNPDTAADTMKRAKELSNSLQAMGLQSAVYNIAAEYKTAHKGQDNKHIKDANDVLQADRAAFENHIAAASEAARRDAIADFLDKIQTEAYKGKETGLPFFDNLLGGGILPQSLLLLLAAPAAGKTTLCAQIAELIAERGEPVIFFNLEMSREQMLAKAISTRLYRRHNYKKTAKEVLQGYRWNDNDRQIIPATIEEYRQEVYPHLKYNPGNVGSNLEMILDYMETAAKAAEAKGKPAPAVVVDYLHKLTSSDSDDVAETIKKAVGELKQYAIRHNTFVITIAAVNRESMKNGRIHIHSGRDSSGIEFEGDYILSLNYKELYNGKVKMHEQDKVDALAKAANREMILKLEKGRFDLQCTNATVYFDAAHNTFYGTEFTPAAGGFIADDNAPAWDEDDGQTILIG